MRRVAFICLSILAVACNSKMHTARIVLLPDTQTYAEKFPHILDTQLNWVARNANNIDFVLQQGDLTQNNNDKEWQVVKNAFARIDHKLPYVLALGNHDMGSTPGKFADTRNTELYNRYFPYQSFLKLPGFAGSFDATTTDNAYYLLQTGRVKWLVLTLEFGPRDTVLSWANDVVSRYPDRLAIINTHSYMYSDSTRQGPGDYWRAHGYGVGKDTGDHKVNDGEQMWNKLVKKHANIRFVFSGHVLNTGVGTLVSINDAGLPVYQMLANYQEGVKGSINGGNGFLRILDMNFMKGTMKVTSWSPYSNEYMDRPGHNFEVKHVLYKPAL
ncbi:metallophosphoesterase [Aridibaculum aurantiacum]|uniref:metallophosphoesterase n=1 Tax=Aridibaculum aurantiacum TaxID=2810307 RepID=UPI001A95A5F3|nr:metallophosphoesterase [Aridibaculum aurantiacum]